MPKSIAEILLQTRENQGINKSEMARKLGVPSQQYGQYEAGKVEPKTEFRLKFEKIFGVDLTNYENNISKSEKEDRKPIDFDRDFWNAGKIINVTNPFNEFEMLAIIHNAFVLAALLMNKSHNDSEEYRKFRVRESYKDSVELYSIMKEKNALSISK